MGDNNNAEMQPAVLDKRLFAHLRDPEQAEDLRRAQQAVFLFGATLLLAFAALIYVALDQSARFTREVGRFDHDIRMLIQLKGYANDSAWLDQQVRQLFDKIYDRSPDPTHQLDRRRLSELSTQLYPMFTRPSPEDEELVRPFMDAVVAPALLGKYPVLLCRVPLFWWAGLGCFYWLVIFYLYGFGGLHPTQGEPVFNVLDVGFFAALVEYTGAIFSGFTAFFAFSLLLSAADFHYQENLAAHTTMRFRRKLAIILGPYVVALGLTFFWAVSDGVLLQGDSVMEFLSRLILLVFFGVLVWFIFYWVLKHGALRFLGARLAGTSRICSGDA